LFALKVAASAAMIGAAADSLPPLLLLPLLLLMLVLLSPVLPLLPLELVKMHRIPKG